MTATVADGVHVTLPIELLAQIAAGLAAAAPIDALPDTSGRRWSNIIRTDQYEALIIAWPPGTGLAMHDHSGSLAALHVVSGRLRERYLESGPTQTSVTERWLEAGQQVELSGDHTHEVVNVDEIEAISVHVYSPPLSDTAFRTNNELERENEVPVDP